MTDLPHDPLDELASAHLDGLTSPEEARRVEGDADLQERVARLRRARDAVRLPDGPADPERREVAITAALAAADDPITAPVTSLADARARRGPPTWVRLVGVAAAVLIAAVVIPRLVRDDHDGTTTLASPGAADDATSKAAESSTAQQDAAATGGSALESAPPDADHPLMAGDSTTTVPNPGGSTLALVDLGPVADLDALAQAVRSELDAPSAPVATPPADPAERDACVSTLRVAGPDGTGSYVLNAVARLGEQDVVVTVTAEPDDTRTLRVYAVSGCTLMDTRSI